MSDNSREQNPEDVDAAVKPVEPVVPVVANRVMLVDWEWPRKRSRNRRPNGPGRLARAKGAPPKGSRRSRRTVRRPIAPMRKSRIGIR